MLYEREQVIECNAGSEGTVGTNQFMLGSVGRFQTMEFYSKYNGKPALITLAD